MKKQGYSKEEIKKMILGLTLNRKIVKEMKGTNGIVYVVDNGKNAHPRFVAFKTLEFVKREIEESELKNFVREARIWLKLRNYALILTPLYIEYSGKIPMICMPFCDSDLESYLEERQKLDLVEVLVFTAHILKALIFAKDRGVESHQDLKPGNILIEDLRKKFDFPSDPCVHESVRLRVRVGDFGLANAWRELGKPQGSFPYMAPEQYTPEEYDTYNPDIFAVGVMMCEMLTGQHPCGKKTKRVWKDWSKRKWEQWAKFGERRFQAGTDGILAEIQRSIQSMLVPDPKKRPGKEEILRGLMDTLREVDKPTFDQLEFLFDYYDSLSGYNEYEKRLRELVEISRLPQQLDLVIDELSKEVSDVEKSIDTPRKAFWFCRLCAVMSGLLLRRREGEDEKNARNLAERLVSEAGRAAWKKSTAITTNLAFSEWIQVLGDEKLTTALLDRIAERSHILTTKGQSYHMRRRNSKTLEEVRQT